MDCRSRVSHTFNIKIIMISKANNIKITLR